MRARSHEPHRAYCGFAMSVRRPAAAYCRYRTLNCSTVNSFLAVINFREIETCRRWVRPSVARGAPGSSWCVDGCVPAPPYVLVRAMQHTRTQPHRRRRRVKLVNGEMGLPPAPPLRCSLALCRPPHRVVPVVFREIRVDRCCRRYPLPSCFILFSFSERYSITRNRKAFFFSRKITGKASFGSHQEHRD